MTSIDDIIKKLKSNEDINPLKPHLLKIIKNIKCDEDNSSDEDEILSASEYYELNKINIMKFYVKNNVHYQTYNFEEVKYTRYTGYYPNLIKIANKLFYENIEINEYDRCYCQYGMNLYEESIFEKLKSNIEDNYKKFLLTRTCKSQKLKNLIKLTSSLKELFNIMKNDFSFSKFDEISFFELLYILIHGKTCLEHTDDEY